MSIYTRTQKLFVLEMRYYLLITDYNFDTSLLCVLCDHLKINVFKINDNTSKLRMVTPEYATYKVFIDYLAMSESLSKDMLSYYDDSLSKYAIEIYVHPKTLLSALDINTTISQNGEY